MAEFVMTVILTILGLAGVLVEAKPSDFKLRIFGCAFLAGGAFQLGQIVARIHP